MTNIVDVPEEDEMRKLIVLTGAYGFTDNDACGYIAALDRDQFLRDMDAAMRTTAEMYEDEDPSMWYVGPFIETLGDWYDDKYDSSDVSVLHVYVRLRTGSTIHA